MTSIENQSMQLMLHGFSQTKYEDPRILMVQQGRRKSHKRLNNHPGELFKPLLEEGYAYDLKENDQQIRLN